MAQIGKILYYGWYVLGKFQSKTVCSEISYNRTCEIRHWLELQKQMDWNQSLYGMSHTKVGFGKDHNYTIYRFHQL